MTDSEGSALPSPAPKVRMGGYHTAVETSYARKVGARVVEVADPHCRRCGHRALDHGLADLPIEERWRWFNRPRLERGEEPRPCRFQGAQPCSCREWEPGVGRRTLLEGYGLVPVKHVWVEASLGGWIAAYRVVPEAGHPVVAEVRLFPDEPNRPGPGRWSGEVLGIAAKAVPPGGVTARLLRQVPIGARLQVMDALLKRMAGASDPFLPWVWGKTPAARRRGPGGRKGRPLEAFADLAAAYVQALKAGSKRPVVDVARARKVRPSRVRDMILRARRLGLLTEGRQGVRGGALTDRARALLKKTRRRAKKPGRGKRGA